MIKMIRDDKLVNIHSLQLGDVIIFNPCNECTGKKVCFFCRKGVENKGTVVSKWLDFDIPAVEVEVKGSDKLLEIIQDDLDNPDLVIDVEQNRS